MQNMRDFFRTSLGRGLRDLSPLDRLATAWPVAAGSALAARAQVVSLSEDRIVHLTVTADEWMQPLLQMRSVLQHDLARIASVPLNGIHFEVKKTLRTQRTGSSTDV
jgi:hypothetical protein